MDNLSVDPSAGEKRVKDNRCTRGCERTNQDPMDQIIERACGGIEQIRQIFPDWMDFVDNLECDYFNDQSAWRMAVIAHYQSGNTFECKNREINQFVIAVIAVLERTYGIHPNNETQRTRRPARQRRVSSRRKAG